MLRLPQVLDAWGTPMFETVLKNALAGMDATHLPLQQGLTRSSYALADKISATLLAMHESAGFIHVKAGIFYTGVIAGCSCADDPTPMDEEAEYCEVRIDIRKNDADTRITLLTTG